MLRYSSVEPHRSTKVAKLESLMGVLPMISMHLSCGLVMASLHSVELCIVEQLLNVMDSRLPDVKNLAISYTESSVLGE